MTKRKRMDGITLVLGGEAGQGIQNIEDILKILIKRSGYHVFATKEYMSRIRGGINTTEIRLSDKSVASHVDGIDILLPLKKEVIPHLGDRVDSKTIIVGDEQSLDVEGVVNVPFVRIAEEIGNRLFANSVALGFLCEVLGLDNGILFELISTTFAKKSETIIEKNVVAVKAGIDSAKRWQSTSPLIVRPDPSDENKEKLVISGADAVVLGALAAGCDSAYAYPMTPGTSVFTIMAEHSTNNDLLVEQVEDEISAVNMALGAWYAGAKPIVSTSGGGFALMTEGVSLSGMIETPLVVHLAQRPGPATGLPTRTEQGDLNLVRYAGHGELSRIILSPGTVEQGYLLSKHAFEVADKYQVPVFIMTDQYYVDSYATVSEFNLPETVPALSPYILETADSYRRYELTEDGISPRGIPGFGTGTVCVDSDEHDETGRITEDLDGVHMQMANKRKRKHETVCAGALEPEIVGPDNFSTLIVGWGSTYNGIVEALQVLNRDDTAFLFCPQVYPLHESIAEHLNKAEKVLAVENNQVGQFADLLHLETGFKIDKRILKYNGMPFSVEELVEKIGAEL